MWKSLSQQIRTRRASTLAVRRQIERSIRPVLEPMEGRTLMTYAAPVTYGATPAPASMTTGDLNMDGNADVITTNYGTSTTSPTATVLIGRGDGTFGAPIVTTLPLAPGSSFTGSQAGTLAVGDVNGDARPDLVVLGGGAAMVLAGNGDGTFGAATIAPTGTSAARLSVADVNHDGRADILAANTVGTVAVTLSNVDGTFTKTEYAAGPSAQDVKAVDLNHDGNLDLAVADAVSAGSVVVLMGRGDGTFGAGKSYAAFSAPYRMTVGDYNGDGNDDVCVANSYTSSAVTVLYGNGDGTLDVPHSYDTGSQPWELNSGDVDGDGRPDLVDSNGSTYQVEYNNGDGTFAAPVSIPGAGLVFAGADFNHDGTIDLAGTAQGTSGIGVMVNQAVATSSISTAVGFSVQGVASTVAGAPMGVTVSAVDASGNVVADFIGTVHLSSTDPKFGGMNFTLTAIDAGTHAFAAPLYTAGVQTISALGPTQLKGSTTVSVAAAVAKQFSVVVDATAVAGNRVSVAVTALDGFGNATSNYTGTVHFTSTDKLAGLPADYTFVVGDNGAHAFAATMRTAGAQTIVATDAINALQFGRSTSIVVTPATTVSFGLVGGGGHIGSAKALTVTARDAFGNLATGYVGSVHLAASDAAMVLAPDAALVNGVGTFAVTPMTLGTQTLAATDANGMAGTETITGTPGDAARLAVTSVRGTIAGATQSFVVTAYDAFGNVAVDYAGIVAFGSSDARFTAGAYQFAASDNGTHTFSVTFRTAGTQALTTYDFAQTSSLTSTQTGIVVTPAAAASLSMSTIVGSVVGITQNVTITARDAFGNVAPDYRGTIAFGSTDTTALLPANYAFAASDAGTHAFSITIKKAGGSDVSVADTVNPAFATIQRDVQFTPAAMAGFAFRAPSNVTAGVAFTMSLAAVDAFGNAIVGYVGKVHFTGPSGGANLLPADYTFTAADAGSHTFTFTLASSGTQTIGVSDLLKTSLKGSVVMTVKTSSSGGGGSTGGGSGGGGKKVV